MPSEPAPCIDELTALRERLQEAESIISRHLHGNDTKAEFAEKAKAFLKRELSSDMPPSLEKLVLPILVARKTMAAIVRGSHEDGLSRADFTAELIRQGLQNRTLRLRRARGQHKQAIAA